MQTTLAITAMHAPVARTGGESPEDDGEASLRPLCAFCAIGVLLGCILSMLPFDARIASLELPLILFSAPLAAVLGFALGSPD